MDKKSKEKFALEQVELLSKLDVGVAVVPYEVSVTKNIVSVWLLLEGDEGIDEDTQNIFTGILKASFKTKGLYLARLNWLSERPAISNRSICTTIRTNAPIEFGQLYDLLASGKFIDFSEKELANRLDVLRKGGLILRLKSEQYVLTYKALSALGTLRSGSSPDVTRMLALASRAS